LLFDTLKTFGESSAKLEQKILAKSQNEMKAEFAYKPAQIAVLLAVLSFAGVTLNDNSIKPQTFILRIPQNEPIKLYNEEMFEWLNVTFLPHVVEQEALTSRLDLHDVTRDVLYKPADKKSIYDRYGPLISTGGGINERRYYISKAGIKGHGIFANVYIPKDSLIGVYTGYLSAGYVYGTYSWDYFSVSSMPIQTDSMQGGNMLRFINDGKDENLNCGVVSVAWENRWHTLYVAIKDIHVGEELTVSYGNGMFLKCVNKFLGYWEDRSLLT
jgi:hypothetical protein